MYTNDCDTRENVISTLGELQSAVGEKRADEKGFLGALTTELGKCSRGGCIPGKRSPEAVFITVPPTVRCYIKGQQQTGLK